MPNRLVRHAVQTGQVPELGGYAAIRPEVRIGSNSRVDATAFQPADDIDPAYGEALRRARRAGVEILAYDVQIDLREMRLNGRLPCRL